MITYRSNQYSVPPKYLGKRLVLQVYDNYLYVYYNTELIVIHPISAKKLNYTHDHYVAISKQTFKEQTMDIEKIAKENLTQIPSSVPGMFPVCQHQSHPVHNL